MKKFKTIFSFSLVFIMVSLFFISCNTTDNDKSTEIKKKITFTQTLNSEANLVEVDKYYVGEGTLDGVKHYIFQVEKDGQKSKDINVSDLYSKIIYVDNTNKDKLGKVLAYERVYSNGKKHFYYELYISKDKIKNIGDLDFD